MLFYSLDPEPCHVWDGFVRLWILPGTWASPTRPAFVRDTGSGATPGKRRITVARPSHRGERANYRNE